LVNELLTNKVIELVKYNRNILVYSSNLETSENITNHGSEKQCLQIVILA